MLKIGQFIYPWGNGHYSRMMRLNSFLPNYIKEYETHYSSKGDIYQKLLKKFPENKENIHEILMPTPIDGKMGPDVPRSLLNLLFSVQDNPPLVRQIASYLRKEGKLYDREKFDLVINDGDMGSNVIAKRRSIHSIFITNQYMPKLWKLRFIFYPSLVFVASQIAKASTIVVADSAPPYTMCEYNLNFSDKIKEKVVYTGHFTENKIVESAPKTNLEKLIEGVDFGYWMRTGNRSTNDGTGQKYEEVFHQEEMKNECRIISHARNDPNIDRVLGKDGKKHSVSEALEKKIDWIQIDIGFLSEQEKNTVLEQCQYAVVNGSHTVMGEIIGGKSKPIIGIPIYDEHTNQLKWAEEKNLGVLANSTKKVLDGIDKIKNNYDKFKENLEEFHNNFNGNGAENTARMISEIIEDEKD